ncbi:MAG: hypothetical protein JO165_10685 [Candidatus Eremiobacteraeota bacterium]|nr:hypothetical protein [Candidatus Eremiobacteraeota bacterium]
MINLNERASAQLLASPLSSPAAGFDGAPTAANYTQGFGTDGIARLLRPFTPQQTDQSLLNVLPTSGMGGIMQMLMSALAQLLSQFGMFAQQPQTGTGPQDYYSQASASSNGDPHLAFNGTDANGTTHTAKFDSMAPHADFLESNCFSGGYRVSTDVTAPAANGITWNQNATVTTNYGNTAVSLNKNGAASVEQNGRNFSLANGQIVDLGNGETVARATDGSLTITDNDGRGGFIATTLRTNGQGVDVGVQAQNVNLSGDVVR